MKLLVLCCALLALIVATQASVIGPQAMAHKEAKKMVETMRNSLHSAFKLLPGYHVAGDGPNITRAQCDSLGGTQFSCLQGACYVLVDCASTFTAFDVKFDQANTTHLDSICKNDCLARIFREFRNFVQSGCLQKLNQNGAEIDFDLNIDAAENMAKFFCTKNPNGEYCILNIRDIGKNNPTLDDNSTINTLTPTSPLCVTLTGLGCCATSLINLMTAVSNLSNSNSGSGGDIPSLSQFTQIRTKCNLTSPGCLALGESRVVVNAMFRITGLSFSTYSGLSFNAKIAVQLGLRRDIARFIRQNGASWCSEQNVFIISITEGSWNVNFQVVGDSSSQTQQATTALNTGLQAAKNNAGDAPSFNSTIASDSSLSSSSASFDTSSATVSQQTESAALPRFSWNAFTILALVVVAFFNRFF